jgi:hypothetical protein
LPDALPQQQQAAGLADMIDPVIIDQAKQQLAATEQKLEEIRSEQQEPEPAPVEEAPSDDPPTDEEVAALIAEIDAIHAQRLGSVTLMVKAFRLNFPVGRTPFAKSITDRQRANWVRAHIDQLKSEIAETEQEAP